MYNIHEVVHVNIDGVWYHAQIVDVTQYSAYVYVYDLGKWRQIDLVNVRRERTA